MSSLTDTDRRYFEKLLDMAGGYVLDFSNATFDEIFSMHRIRIHHEKYQKYGSSKAKKLRAFWEIESDSLVATVMSEMLDAYEVSCDLNGHEKDEIVLSKCRQIVERLSGKKSSAASPITEDQFLKHEFAIPNIHKLPLDAAMIGIIEIRLEESRIALGARAYLSVIMLCGSVLEAVLLGAALQNAQKFNRSASSPKDISGKVKKLHEWSLSQLIDVSYEVGLIGIDVKKFSHGLRDFRNYIHPYQQLASGFSPDEHTARVCFQVLKAGLANLSGDR